MIDLLKMYFKNEITDKEFLIMWWDSGHFLIYYFVVLFAIVIGLSIISK